MKPLSKSRYLMLMPMNSKLKFSLIISIYLFTRRLEKLKSLKINDKQSQPCIERAFELNETIRVNTKINENNLKGWMKGTIEQRKGEFFLVNLSSGNLNNLLENKKIFHISEIRKLNE